MADWIAQHVVHAHGLPSPAGQLVRVFAPAKTQVEALPRALDSLSLFTVEQRREAGFGRLGSVFPRGDPQR